MDTIQTDTGNTEKKQQAKSALWQGRFEMTPDAEAIAFETSIHVDSRMALDDIRGSIAHVRMLGSECIIAQEESDAIIAELGNIACELQSGALTIDENAEDIHSFVEGVLTERLGDIGRKVHTGRSRNDQIALDERLYIRRAVPDLQLSICTLIETLSGIACAHTNSLISGYTHLQRAQPVTLAHHLCAWAWMLTRDYERLGDALKRVTLSPLGSGALAGSGLPLNRQSVAAELGFDGVTPNSLDTVADRDYCIELTSDFSLLMMHLSRFCEEVILWSTEEFKYIELSEKWSTGSSIMPQKKNPDFAELIRGRTGRVYGDLLALLTLMKGLPLSYNRDMQEDKYSFFDAFDTTCSCVRIFTHMIGTANWNVEKMEASCTGGYANATDLADYLVRKGLPFRSAHGVAASCVRDAIGQKSNLEDMSLAALQKHSALIEEDIYSKITPRACVEARNITGGPHAEQVTIQLDALRSFVQCARGGQINPSAGEMQ